MRSRGGGVPAPRSPRVCRRRPSSGGRPARRGGGGRGGGRRRWRRALSRLLQLAPPFRRNAERPQSAAAALSERLDGRLHAQSCLVGVVYVLHEYCARHHLLRPARRPDARRRPRTARSGRGYSVDRRHRLHLCHLRRAAARDRRRDGAGNHLHDRRLQHLGRARHRLPPLLLLGAALGGADAHRSRGVQRVLAHHAGDAVLVRDLRHADRRHLHLQRASQPHHLLCRPRPAARPPLAGGGARHHLAGAAAHKRALVVHPQPGRAHAARRLRRHRLHLLLLLRALHGRQLRPHARRARRQHHRLHHRHARRAQGGGAVS
mmetsp:Transcript_21160/g.66237  ORF Transcript_21160/g.66237 Transcript_21160/m.66237 type:complete len:319 (-) Transcript_21160:913-1869(-)